MTLSSLWSAKCSGLSEGERGKTSPAGELQSSSHNANLIAPYASEKIAYGLQITCTVCTTYRNAKYKRYHALIYLDLPYGCVQVQTVQVVRTSSVKNALFTGSAYQRAMYTVHPLVLARIILISATFKVPMFPNSNFGEAGLPCCLPTGNLFGLCVGPMQGARSPDGRSWRSGQFGRSFGCQGPGMKDISEGFRGKPLICSLLGS